MNRRRLIAGAAATGGALSMGGLTAARPGRRRTTTLDA